MAAGHEAWRNAGEAFATNFWQGARRRPTPQEVAYAFALHRERDGAFAGALLQPALADELLGRLARGVPLANLREAQGVTLDRVDLGDRDLDAFMWGVSAADAKQLAEQAAAHRPRARQLELFPGFTGARAQGSAADEADGKDTT